MSSTDALILILVFGSIGILLITATFITVVIWHQRRWMAAMEERIRYRDALLEAAAVGRLIPWSCLADGSKLTLGDSVTTILKALPEDISSIDQLLTFVHSTHRDTLASHLANAQPEEDVVLKATMRDATDKLIPTRWQFRRRGDTLKGIIRDISQEERLQQQLLQAQKLESLGTLVGGVAHEFGNLLASVESCAKVVKRRVAEDPKGNQGIHLILEATDRGRGIIRQLLDFSRHDPERIQVVHLRKLMDELIALLGPLLGRSYQIRLEMEPEVPAVIADPVRVHQALLNLCINARDAMPQGGPLIMRVRKLVLDASEAELRGKRPGTYVRIEVEDAGTGIDPEHLTRIFEPFFTTKAPGHGTGLGLSVTHSIAEAHGGFILCESDVGHGSRFSLCLKAE